MALLMKNSAIHHKNAFIYLITLSFALYGAFTKRIVAVCEQMESSTQMEMHCAKSFSRLLSAVSSATATAVLMKTLTISDA